MQDPNSTDAASQAFDLPGRNRSIYRIGAAHAQENPVQMMAEAKGARYASCGQAQNRKQNNREVRTLLIDSSAMGDEEDEDAMLQEAAKTAWVRVFIREASKRGHTGEDVFAVLDEPGMTAKEAVERILSARKLR